MMVAAIADLSPTPDTAATIEFLRNWSPEDYWCLTAIIPDGKTETRTFLPSEAEKASRWIESHQGKRNIYFTLNTVSQRLSSKPNKAAIANFRAFHVDCDPRTQEDLGSEQARIESLFTTKLPAGIPPPSVVWFSGGGYQAAWLLAEPLAIPAPTDSEPEPWKHGEAVNRGLEQAFGADAVHNCDRLLRAVGSLNIPNKKKAAKGRRVALARLVFADWSRRYAVSDFAHLKRYEAAPTQADPRAKLASVGPRTPTVLGKGAPIPAGVAVEDLRAYAATSGASLKDATLALIATGDASKWDGDRSKMVFAVVCDLVRAGLPDELIVGLLLDKNNVAFYGHIGDQKTDRVRYAQRQIERARAEVAKAAAIPTWDRVTKDGNPLPSYWNARTALQLMGVDCRYDKFRDRHIVGSHELQEFAGNFSDHAERILRDEIIRRFGFDPGEVHTYRAVLSLCTENRFDSLVDHVNTLPQWDGVSRLDSWLTDYLGTEANAYTSEAGAAWLTAAVLRAFEPGAKFDYMLVLMGAQGVGKSSALRLLAGDEFFSDAPFLHARDAREVMEVSAGVWILECAELDGIGKRDVNTLRATITRQEDTGRPAYARSSVTQPRRFVLAGTTNEDRFLMDPAGNRRFWPVEVKRVDLAGLTAARDQLFAEALSRYRAGTGRVTLTAEAELLAKAAQDRRRVVDDGYTESLESLSPTSKRNGQWCVTNDAVYRHLDIPTKDRCGGIPRKVRDAMIALGWLPVAEPVRVEGKKHRIYFWSGEGKPGEPTPF